MKKTFSRPVAAVLALAFTSGLAVSVPALAQDQGPASLGGVGAAPVVPALPPFARTRAILQAQNAPTLSRSAPTSGAESGKVYENYLGSIGKGGAGPKIESLSTSK
ncbi:MAG: hypothetical protein OJI70_12305 [Zavarzinia sp.]|nr:hypothetical protein [Zavarzinia sp.]